MSETIRLTRNMIRAAVAAAAQALTIVAFFYIVGGGWLVWPPTLALRVLGVCS